MDNSFESAKQLEKIFEVLAEIQMAVEMANQNRKEFVGLQERAKAIEDDLSELDEINATNAIDARWSMDGTKLVSLRTTLHRALELAKNGEKKSRLCRLGTAQDLSKQLRRVQNDVSRILQEAKSTSHFGSIGEILNVVAQIEEAVKKAKHIREEVACIVQLVNHIGSILSQHHKYGLTKNQWLDPPALQPLHRDSLHVLELIKNCVKKNKRHLLCTARRDLSNQLLNISRRLQIFTHDYTVAISTILLQPLVVEEVTDDGPSTGDTRGHGWSGKGKMKKEIEVEDPSAITSVDLHTHLRNPEVLEENTVKTGLEAPAAILSGLKMFGLSELNDATNNFSNDKIIGKGDYSIVYKGVLHDGLVVSLKVLRDPHDPDSVFQANLATRLLDELKIGAKVKHKNIVKYLGYRADVKTQVIEHNGSKVCVRKCTNLLVLDYLPNGSLKDIVEGKQLVELSSCFRIIQDIAQGVHYLHEQRVVHGDLKPANILFDASMSPVIVDFGMSIILEGYAKEKFRWDGLVGTIGYTAPETIELGCLSMKSDVFAFGACLVQTIIILSTGRRDWHDAQDWVQKAGGIKGLLDPIVQVNESQLIEINRYLKVGWLCMDENPAERPTMAEVVQMLSGEKKLSTSKNRSTKEERPDQTQCDAPTWLQYSYIIRPKK